MDNKIKNEEIEITESEEKLEKTIKNNKISNLKCNIKKIKAIAKLGFIICIVPGVSYTTLKHFNYFETKKPVVEQIIVSSTGEISKYRGYDLDDQSYLKYYSKWEPTALGKYHRIVSKYYIKDDDYTKIINLTKNSMLNEEVLNDQFDIYKQKHNIEVSDNIPNEEINKEYIEGVISKIDNEDVKVDNSPGTWAIGLMLLSFINGSLIPAELIFLNDKGILKKIRDDLIAKPDITDTNEIKRKIKEKNKDFK